MSEGCEPPPPSQEILLERVRGLEREVERLTAELSRREGGGKKRDREGEEKPRTPKSDGGKEQPDGKREGGGQQAVEEGAGSETGGVQNGAQDCGGHTPRSRKKSSQAREFDFGAHPRRHVALRLSYHGWAYQGFACQENTGNTVEARLFEALLKTRLIADRQTSNYHRCGRTDKGVSAFSQVVSIDLRSTQFGGGLGVTPPSCSSKNVSNSAELPYVKILNRVLPEDIRVLDWAPVNTGFSARFDCQSRTYRYYFPRGALDVPLMKTAAKRYEGTHDFRNLCKMDVGNGVLQFQRTILSADITPVRSSCDPSDDPYDLFVFEVTGLAFLYHQVRCMMAVLLLIGQKLEAPEIIDQLLDVENNPRKPQYSMAVDFPLVLYDCCFEGVSWQGGDSELSHSVLSRLQQQWTELTVKTELVRDMIRGLHSAGHSSTPLSSLLEGSRPRQYRPLLERPCCESLESRIDHFVKRGRLERGESEEGGAVIHRGKKAKHTDS
ncbi:tRNA pseudouridine(38/39) synthase [Acipenser ruthenus]|uniref:tRNA pseudouridine(38/39) synthase n=1 Tax=Acipenser ruthenus TaxID=7906 RepID=A0A444U9B2_ACIRT|nr:tRNA pseudouridine(38/39) synthase [Acipenser ruthenus]